MKEAQFRRVCAKEIAKLNRVASRLSASAIMAALWPAIEQYKQSGKTYGCAVEIVNAQLGNRFSVATLRVAASKYKRDQK